jgi:hypothetical protein
MASQIASDVLLQACGPVEGTPESIFFHPPVAMLDAIEQDHRNPVAVGILEPTGLVDVDRVPTEPELAGQPIDHRLGVLAQMTTAPGDHAYAVVLSCHFLTLPVTVSGSESTTSISRGSLKRASHRAASARTAAASSSRPGAGTT